MNPKNAVDQAETPGRGIGPAESEVASPSIHAAEALGKVLSALYRFFTLYPPNHPSIKEAEARLLGLLQVFYGEADRVTVGFLGSEFIVLGKHLYQVKDKMQGLSDSFRDKGIEKIRFVSGVDGAEIREFFAGLLQKAEAASESAGDDPPWRGKCPHILVGRFHTDWTITHSYGDETPSDRNEEGEVEGFLESCKELVTKVREQKVIEFSLAREIIENILSGLVLEDHAIPIITQTKQHDEYTYTHSLNVSTLSLAMGRLLGFSPAQLRELGLAALLHDTGKLLIPKEILQKEEGLSEEEYGLIQMHPVHGASMLMKCRGIPDVAPVVAFEHHIRFDGGGYPQVGKSWKPNLCSRITAIADIFDAMRTNRAYRNEVSKEETLRQMATMRIDPFLFNVFARVTNLYSVGEYVRLDTNHVGVIHEINPQNAFRPKVKILFDADRNEVEGERILNLSLFDKKKKRFLHSVSTILSKEEIENLA